MLREFLKKHPENLGRRPPGAGSSA